MKKEDLSGLYLLTISGNINAYERLLNEFIRLSKIIIVSFLENKRIPNVKYEDVSIALFELFIFVLTTYNPFRKDFEKYSKFIVRQKVKNFVFEIAGDKVRTIFSLDNDSDIDDVICLDEYQGTKYYDIGEEIIADRIKYFISSKDNEKLSNSDRQRQKFNRLRLAGYKLQEICKIMKISEGKARYFIKLNENDPELYNLKLELK